MASPDGDGAPVGRPRETPTGSGRPIADEMTAMLDGRFPGLVGMRILEASASEVTGELRVREELLAPNGYLHAATVVALADTVCGVGARLALPAEASGFTTLELKTNYLGTARSGTVSVDATLVHSGRRTQLWDATVRDGAGRAIALFRCTQMVLYPSASQQHSTSRSEHSNTETEQA
ncbi:PaaI family thioesterase [Rhodococcus maanshanensis]|uniref:PaaI family thioesterase n=1 Tax=Rhodococcus maanshanensis TaxID=183556 RepID=UPI0022B4451B|nr:PaaI family thioesterase [Rhodococcus maanshanensis]MCZ4555732.1 PaaI family thioesterase [Rhodococcus maanshanensis]